MQILVVDDEALARKRIVKFLAESELETSIIEASNGKEAISYLTSENPDLVFLDIQMTDMTGFDVLAKIPATRIPIIIFVTAFNNFAVQAFEVQALDFLLKPYKKERFFEALDRGIRQLRLKDQEAFQGKVVQLMQFMSTKDVLQQEKSSSYLTQIVLKKNKKYYFVKTEDINYIKSSGYYAEIFTMSDEKHVYRISMSDFSEKLNPSQFSRINRSTIINIDNVKEVISEGMGDFSVIAKDGSTFGVTKNYKPAFLKQMGIR